MAHPKPCIHCKHYFDNDWGGSACHRLKRTEDHPVYGTRVQVYAKDPETERSNEPEHRGPNYCGSAGQFFEPTLLRRVIIFFMGVP